MGKTIMSPDHPDWNEFVMCMMDLESCDRVPKDTELTCDGTQRITRLVLETFKDIDIEATLEYFQEFGGYCDCEVNMNTLLILVPNEEDCVSTELFSAVDNAVTKLKAYGLSFSEIKKTIKNEVEKAIDFIIDALGADLPAPTPSL